VDWDPCQRVLLKALPWSAALAWISPRPVVFITFFQLCFHFIKVATKSENATNCNQGGFNLLLQQPLESSATWALIFAGFAASSAGWLRSSLAKLMDHWVQYQLPCPQMAPLTRALSYRYVLDICNFFHAVVGHRNLLILIRSKHI